MGAIQSSINAAMSGTAYLLQLGKIGEKHDEKVGQEAVKKDRSDRAHKAAETRRKNREAQMTESLQTKADAKQNGRDVAERLKIGMKGMV